MMDVRSCLCVLMLSADSVFTTKIDKKMIRTIIFYFTKVHQLHKSSPTSQKFTNFTKVHQLHKGSPTSQRFTNFTRVHQLHKGSPTSQRFTNFTKVHQLHKSSPTSQKFTNFTKVHQLHKSSPTSQKFTNFTKVHQRALLPLFSCMQMIIFFVIVSLLFVLLMSGHDACRR
jgi:hypothetical protein